MNQTRPVDPRLTRCVRGSPASITCWRGWTWPRPPSGRNWPRRSWSLDADRAEQKPRGGASCRAARTAGGAYGAAAQRCAPRGSPEPTGPKWALTRGPPRHEHHNHPGTEAVGARHAEPGRRGRANLGW